MWESVTELLLGLIFIAVFVGVMELAKIRAEITKIRSLNSYLADHAQEKDPTREQLHRIDIHTQESAKTLDKIERRMDQFTKSDTEVLGDSLRRALGSATKPKDDSNE